MKITKNSSITHCLTCSNNKVVGLNLCRRCYDYLRIRLRYMKKSTKPCPTEGSCTNTHEETATSCRSCQLKKFLLHENLAEYIKKNMENSELKTRLFGAEKENQRGPYKRKAKKEKTVLKSKGPLNLPTSPDLSNDEFTRLEANYEFYKKCSKPIKTNEDSDLDYLDSSRFMDLDMSDEWLSSSEKKLMYFRANVNKASLEQPNQSNSFQTPLKEHRLKDITNTQQSVAHSSNFNDSLNSSKLSVNSPSNFYTVFYPSIIPLAKSNAKSLREPIINPYLLDDRDTRSQVENHLKQMKQLDKLVELDTKNKKFEVKDLSQPKMSSQKIYEPLLASNEHERSLQLSHESHAIKLKLFDQNLKILREQSKLLDTFHYENCPQDISQLNQKFTYTIDYLNEAKLMKQQFEFNGRSVSSWYEKQLENIREEWMDSCEKYRADYNEKKMALKEAMMSKERAQLHRNQHLAKSEIDSKFFLKSPNKELANSLSSNTVSNSNKSNLNASSNANKTNLGVSLVTTRSKKRQAVSKLRPRLNGRASTNLPMLNKTSKSRKHVDREDLPATTRTPKTSSTNFGHLNAKRSQKSNSIESKLKINFMLDDDAINNDLKLLNKI